VKTAGVNLYASGVNDRGMTARDELTDQGKLLFGAGFVFGVTVTLCLLAVVLVAVTRVPATAGERAASPLLPSTLRPPGTLTSTTTPVASSEASVLSSVNVRSVVAVPFGRTSTVDGLALSVRSTGGGPLATAYWPGLVTPETVNWSAAGS